MRSDRVNAGVALMAPNLERHPDKVAYLCGEKTLTFRELDRYGRSFAALLQKHGIAPGERVVIVLPDSPAFPILFLGCLLSGAMAVPISALSRDEVIESIAYDSGARLLVTSREMTSRFESFSGVDRIIICNENGLPEDSETRSELTAHFQPSADDLAYMLYSSGSTGRPKGVPHRHGSLLLPCELVGENVLGINGDDVIFSTSKFSYAYGLINSFAFPLFFGASAILHPGKPDPAAVFAIMECYSPSVLFSVPTVYARMLLSQEHDDLSLPLRLCCSAGEALPSVVFEEWRRRTGLEILDGMGATEMAYHFTCNTPGQALTGSAGRLVPGYRARLVDDIGDDVAAGCEGHLLIGGETRSPFYWNLPEANARSMTADGFFRTGDICVERGGFYFHMGRSDDRFKVDGQWVSLRVVEEAIREHVAVAECAVVAETIGVHSRPGAFVVLKGDAKWTEQLARELKEYISVRLPAYMCPVRYSPVRELPRTESGKLKRLHIKELKTDDSGD